MLRYTYFDKSDMLFLRFGELKSDLSNVVRRTCRFLGVTGRETWDTQPRAKNATRVARSLWVRRVVCNVFGRGSFVDRVDKKFNRRSQTGYPPMSEHLRRRLKDHFEEPNRNPEMITGLDLDAWR